MNYYNLFALFVKEVCIRTNVSSKLNITFWADMILPSRSGSFLPFYDPSRSRNLPEVCCTLDTFPAHNCTLWIPEGIIVSRFSLLLLLQQFPFWVDRLTSRGEREQGERSLIFLHFSTSLSPYFLWIRKEINVNLTCKKRQCPRDDGRQSPGNLQWGPHRRR